MQHHPCDTYYDVAISHLILCIRAVFTNKGWLIGDVITSIHGLHTWFFRSSVSLDIRRREFPFLPTFLLIISYLWPYSSNAHSDTLSSVGSFISNSNLRLLPAKRLCRSARVVPRLPASLITVSCKTLKKNEVNSSPFQGSFITTAAFKKIKIDWDYHT